jgi:uncharacterized protein
MMKEIIWKSSEYGTVEHCSVELTPEWNAANSRISCTINGQDIEVHYKLETDEHWRTRKVEIIKRSKEMVNNWHLIKSGEGWLVNDHPAADLEGCMDIDISLTPLTNTLPIRRLDFISQPHHRIEVVYIDMLAGEISKVRQHYTRLSGHSYLYENDDGEFSARLNTDSEDFVIDYEGLFERVGGG